MDQYYADLCKRLRSKGRQRLADICSKIDIIDKATATPKKNKRSIEFKLEGNKFYSEGEYRMALVSYNKALCCAEIGSEDVGIIYANRSAVALEKKLYPECLKNIQLARQHNYPMKILVKLNEREKKCLKLISMKKTLDPNPETFIKLLFGPNIEPFTIDCLEIVHKTNEKPFLITNRDLEVGEKIAVQNTFVGVLMVNSYYMNCSNCMKECLFDLIPCDECRSAMFCSEKCKNSVLEIHKYECRIVSLFNLNSDVELPFINCRALFKALSLFNGSVEELKQFVEESNELLSIDNCNGTNEKSFLKSYNSLNCRPTVENDLLEFTLSIYPKIRSMMVNPESRNFLISFISKFHSTLVTGTIYEYEYHGGFYTLSAVMTLSCAPNVTGTILSDGKMLFIVQHPIKAGAKLTMDQGANHAYLSQTEIREKNFQITNTKCNCVACVENYPMIEEQKIISQPSLMDAEFRVSRAISTLTGIEALNLFKENNQLIHDNFDKYPCQEITLLMFANVYLLCKY